MSPAKIADFPNAPIAKWLTLVLQFAVVPIAAILMLHDRSLVKIESTRYTVHDSVQRDRAVAAEFLAMWKAIGDLPPDAFERKVDAIEDYMHVIDLRLTAIESSDSH